MTRIENMNNYHKFKEHDKIMSRDLGEALDISEKDLRVIDDWFATYLERHSGTTTFDKGLAFENELKELHDIMFKQTSSRSHKYILPKLIKYHNISASGFLKSALVARLQVLLRDLISRYMNEINVSYSPSEFVLAIIYLRDNFTLSPNGELVENMLKINSKHKITAKSTREERQNIIANMLYIITREGYHHDIVCFKKILELITADDIKLMEQVKKIKDTQGCYFLTNLIFNTPLPSGELPEDFDLKREMIFWLDSPAGARPRQNWIDKMHVLKEKIGLLPLLSICDKIVENEHLKNYYFNEISYWGDNVCKRFIKSARWTKEYNHES
ncbi:MAG: hypothetical protein LBK58_08575 [Prevotellaceae bacterium]|jgi:hypothetical protein|nr:hypothetical protein [Prevotellaceae bacterium]